MRPKEIPRFLPCTFTLLLSCGVLNLCWASPMIGESAGAKTLINGARGNGDAVSPVLNNMVHSEQRGHEGLPNGNHLGKSNGKSFGIEDEYEDEDEDAVLPGLILPESTGVLFATEEARRQGYSDETEAHWANLGQGAPQVGTLPGGSVVPDVTNILDSREYGPVNGVWEFRQAVADYYNRTYRQGKKSQYTAENVFITPGGRPAMTRLARVTGKVKVGYQVPEYTAYEEMLSMFSRIVPFELPSSPNKAYKMPVDALPDIIKKNDLSVVVASNPRNPTGTAMEGEQLNKLVQMARPLTKKERMANTRHKVTIMVDEFYSWYKMTGELGKSVSAAEFVEDVNRDSVIIIDGLTKNWRLPGWRIGWIVGPKSLNRFVGNAASGSEGGANAPLQRAAVELMQPDWVEKEKKALQVHFREKKEKVVTLLNSIGLKVDPRSEWTFYSWVSISHLPDHMSNAMKLFYELLEKRVIVVPGNFFHINPGKTQDITGSPYQKYIRISWGPAFEEVKKGIERIKTFFEEQGVLHLDVKPEKVAGSNAIA